MRLDGAETPGRHPRLDVEKAWLDIGGLNCVESDTTKVGSSFEMRSKDGELKRFVSFRDDIKR